MPRYKLTIAYDGTDFHGWQRQLVPPDLAHERHVTNVAPAGANVYPRLHESGRVELRSVQSVVETAVREVVREPVVLDGASRTDAGVHARGQCGAFTCEADGPQGRGWPAERGTTPLVRAINSRLPGDCLVRDAVIVDDDFNPIADCVSKGYSYTLHVSPERPLWDRRYVTHCWVPLDVEAMKEAAARLVGRHDFAAFAAAGHGRQSTVREVMGCEVERGEERHGGTEARRHEGGERDGETGRRRYGVAERETGEWAGRVRIDVWGDGFLYNMVRIIAGTLVEVGRGKMAPERIGEIIEGRDRRAAGPTLPPEGLCLEWIEYGERHEGGERDGETERLRDEVADGRREQIGRPRRQEGVEPDGD